MILRKIISTFIQNWRVNTAKILVTGPTLLSAFFLVSCEEPIEIEGDLVPGGDRTEIRYAEIPLTVTSHVAFDSLLVSSNSVSGSRGQIFVGHYNSSEIGNVTAEAYFSLFANEKTYKSEVKQGSQVIETKLYLDFNYYYGDDFGSAQQFRVFQLEDTLPISSPQFTIYDEFTVGQEVSISQPIVVNPTDTLRSIVPLSNTLGQRMINLLADSSNATKTNDKLRGFKITTDQGVNNIQAIDLVTDKSYVEIRYKPSNADTVLTAIFNMGGFNGLPGTSFTNVDYQPGTLIPTTYSADGNFELTDPNKVYFNNLLGISPQLNLDAYLSFVDTVEFLQISKAEISIDRSDFDEDNSATKQKRPIQNVVPYILSEKGMIDKVGEYFWAFQANFDVNGGVVDPTSGLNPASLFYNKDSKQLNGDVSFFLQEIYDNPDFWQEGTNFLFTGQFLRRNETPFNETPKINLGNFDDILVDKKNVKLKIYYTTFK